jgi:putative N6-adenine-specific DNA methylase
MRLFVTCAAHLEPYLEKEIKSLGYDKTSIGFRGVFVDADEEAIYTINYYSRIATRVLMPLKSIKVFRAQDLYEEALAFPWEKYIKNTQTFSIDAAIHHREFKNSLYGIQLIKDAICDRIRNKTKERPNVDTKEPDIQVHCYLDEKIGVISIDTSNPPLFKRGWRVESVEAPLQETLASIICEIADVENASVICDPCCGSGTIAIEACMKKLNIPSGFYRKEFGFQNLPFYNADQFEAVKHKFPTKQSSFKIIATDKDPKAIESCQKNIQNAGLSSYIFTHRIDLAAHFSDPNIDLIMTNPPFGKRLKIQSSFFQDLKRFLSRLKSTPKVFLLLEEDQVGPHLPLKILNSHELASGGLKLKLVQIDPKF